MERSNHKASVRSCAIAALTLTCTVVAAETDKVSAPGRYSGYSQAAYDDYQRSSFYLPVRDGTRLAVDLFRPTRAGQVASEPLPVVWMHTPYNRRHYAGAATVERYPGYALQLVKYGYNVAVVDFRGLYASFGRNRSYNRGEWLEPARTDAYDVTEWFARQPWSNGAIGMWGCSATGGSQMQAATTLPPSLKAIMPMSAEFDVYAFEVLGGVANPGPVMTSGGTTPNANALRDAQAVAVDGSDAPELLAQAVGQHRDNIESPGVVPFRDSHSAPLEDEWWNVSSPSTYLRQLKRSRFGVYAAANWDEAGTKPGAFLTFNNLPRADTKLIVGPQTHCAWSKVEQETGLSIVTEELRFFDHWLKGIDNHVMDQRVTYYTYHAPKGQEWRTAATWPLRTQRLTRYYLAAGTLDTREPEGVHRDTAPMSAPAQSTAILIKPQSGGISYQSEALTHDTQVTGYPVANLWIVTDASDVDVTARIDDVSPDGESSSYQMLGRLRASERALGHAPYDNLGLPWHSYRAADARALRAGEPAQLEFELLPMSYIFRTGHRIRVTVTFADPAQRTDAVPTVSLLSDSHRRSYVTLPLIP
ncbi:MAG TPA: CocE/NonD family hydrolase [Steroidobacteraceae bacterium]|jgi:predicted acyl esterase|nr:CocE/NonD family hydrolase [Steroidobacteraceae bacterium]